MRYHLLVFFVGLLVLAAAGCMDYSQRIVIREDGSAAVTLDAWLDKTLTGLSGDMKDEDFSGNIFLDELEGDPGIEVLKSSVETDEETGAEHHHVEFTAASAGAFENLASFAETGGPRWEVKSDEVTYEQVITNEVEEYETPEDEELIRSLFEGYTWTYSVEMPAPVTETNGTVGADGRTVTWDWSLFYIAMAEEIKMTAKCKL